ncbi:oligopeptide ABC transporter permease [Jiangella mangrovi]|uniref:Peptide/nickel transport system permease protein n=1 Tax=Jiangella mangrovi TaxID=1524084 RepID=A0A7W9GWX2_9ACTN|nr:oligopeptide ABC transporter permease [Jiangella mangrovi]MBB5791274.1 peptide/nickel transport system permease protein [Jiangella mangrovi]
MTTAIEPAPALATAVPATRGPRGLAWRRFKRHRMAMAGLVTLSIVILAALLADVITPHHPNAVDLTAFRQPPSAEHWLGTDSAGRDVFARLLHAGRVSLGVGIAASLISVAIGTLLGAVAGLFRGWADTVIMRTADIMLSFPALVVIIVVAGVLGPSVVTLVLAMGVFGWPAAGRVVRGVTLSVREREFVKAARSFGAGGWWLITRHLVPAALGPVTVVATLGVAQAIMAEATLSFLGLGVVPPAASWGNMLTDAQNLTLISGMPWMWLPPGIAVALTVLAVNFVGDGLRDALDPQTAQGRLR